MTSSSFPSSALDSTSDFMTSSIEADVTPIMTKDFQLQTALTLSQQSTSGPLAQLTAAEESIFQGVLTALTVLALSANCLSLLVIYGVVSQLTPPLRLLTSLSFAQMLTPWAVMTIYLSRSPCRDEIHTSVLLTSHNATALTLFALAMIHNIASFRPFHYTSIASARRLWVSVAVIWIVSLTLGHVHFLVSLGSDDDHHATPYDGGYCSRVAHHTGISLSISLSLAFVVILTGVVIYRRILASLLPVEAFFVNAPSSRSPNGVVTGIALLTCYAVAWVPYLVVRMVVAHGSVESRTSLMVTGIWQAVIVVSCFIDPVIYGVRMETLRNGYGKLAQRIRNRVAGAWVRCRSRLRCLDDDDFPTTPLNHIDAISY